MSISSALSNALSGLSAGARLAEIASGNIANALTEGYARRDAQLAPRQVGTAGLGVEVTTVARQVNAGLEQELNLAGAGQASTHVMAEGLKRIEKAYGEATEEGSLSGRIAALEKALIEAAARPDSDARLIAVVDGADRLGQGLRAVSNEIGVIRQGAEDAIALSVNTLNSALRGVQQLNTRITQALTRGDDANGLLDQRQELVGKIAELVPVRQIARAHDQIALVTTGGTVLLDGRAAKVGFDAKTIVQADMALANGGLSGLTIDGEPVATTPGGGRFGDGRIAALFDLRDRVAPAAQTEADALARDLIERFSGPAVDPTLAVGEAGLFLDRDGPLTAATAPGLAGRIAVTPVLDGPSTVWRLKDGLNAAGPSGEANPSILKAATLALTAVRTLPGGPAASFSGLATRSAAQVATARLTAEADQSFAATRREGLAAELMRQGVDTDRELQDLLQIERAYAANARVIQTVDEMLRTMLEI